MTKSDEVPVPTFGPTTKDQEQVREVMAVARARRSMARAWATIIAAGIASGFVVWGLGEWALHSFAPTYALTKEQIRDKQKASAEIKRQRRVYETQVASITYGALGAALGFALGLAGGFMNGLRSRGLSAALAGTIVGTTSCAALVLTVMPYYYRVFDASIDKRPHDMLLPLTLHAAIWMCAGAAGGGALGLGLGTWSVAIRGALGGGLGALLGTVLYEVVGALRFPMAGTAQPIADEWEPRIIALLSVAILATIMAFLATGFAPSPEVPSPEDGSAR